jgi:hypothetical protein
MENKLKQESIEELKKITFSKNNFSLIKKMLLEIENSNGAILFLIKRKLFKLKEKKQHYNKLESEICGLKNEIEAYKKEDIYLLREENKNLFLEIKKLREAKKYNLLDGLSIKEISTIKNLINLLKEKT